jgi:hypothetical protein
MWTGWRAAGRRIRSADRRDQFLGAYAPLALLATLLIWVLALIVGFGLLLHGLRADIRPQMESLGTACYLAGVALFTIGFGDLIPTSPLTRAVILLAASSGLAVVALVISLLFNLQTAFQRRESAVIALDARAGAPPSGVVLLETYAAYGMRDQLPALFAAWELWSAEVLESHRAFPLLPYFRSSHDNESWVSSLEAMLDAAALIATTIAAEPTGAAQFFYRVGVHAADDLSLWCGLHCGQSPGITRAEWEAARERLAVAGYKVVDVEHGWRVFAQYRSAYADRMRSLARHYATGTAGWSGEGYTAPHSNIPPLPLGQVPAMGRCTHLEQVRDVAPRTKGCEECVKAGTHWVHLRFCRTCGHVGCCDDSYRHASAHFKTTGHPIMESLEPGETWAWCFADEMMVDLEPHPAPAPP